MTPETLWIFGILTVITAITFLKSKRSHQKELKLKSTAQSLGLEFHPEKNLQLVEEYKLLNELGSKSENAYAFNVMIGKVQNGSLCAIFDYHYETHSTEVDLITPLTYAFKNEFRIFRRKRTSPKKIIHDHYLCVFTITLPGNFPELEIRPESLKSRWLDPDIDFESIEFSNRHRVHCADKKFAYDFCNAQMITYLLSEASFANLVLEVQENVLALTFDGQLDPEEIIKNYQTLINIQRLIPNYLYP